MAPKLEISMNGRLFSVLLSLYSCTKSGLRGQGTFVVNKSGQERETSALSGLAFLPGIRAGYFGKISPKIHPNSLPFSQNYQKIT